MTIKESQEKSTTSRYRTHMHNKISVFKELNSPLPNPLGHNVFGIIWRYNLYSTSKPDKLVESEQQREI